MPYSGTGSNTVSYLGELFLQRKRPNALLNLLGGIQQNIRTTTSHEFPVGTFYTLPSPSQPARLEGGDAPAANNTTITQATNVAQIFHESVSTSYLGQGEKSVSGVVPIPQGGANGPVINPRSPEFQVMATLEKIAQDMNYSMLNGVYVNPGDPRSTAIQTRGILTAITTNIVDKSTVVGAISAAMYRSYIELLLQSMITYNGYAIDETFVMMAGPVEYSNTAAAWTALGQIYVAPETEMFGVKVRKIQTTFGTLHLVLEPDVKGALATTVAAGHAVTTGDGAAYLTSVAGLVVGDSLNFDTAGTVETFAITAINAGSGVVTINGAFAHDHAAGVVVTRGGIVSVLNLGAAGLVGMEVPGKGILFEEPLAKTGASDSSQIYGQFGIDHGPEYLHGIARVPQGVALSQ